MAGGNTILELKHHILNGRLSQSSRLIAASQFSLEDCRDEDGNSALHWCAHGLGEDGSNREASDLEVFVDLLEKGAAKNAQNSLGETPLFVAVRLCSSDPTRAVPLIEGMLRRGLVDPHRPNMIGETPLMEACSAGNETLGRLLLEFRASPLHESSAGITAAEIAERSGSDSLVALLQSPLAHRAAEEARQEDAEGKLVEEREALREQRREEEKKKAEQTLFGQKLQPGLANDRDRPGKPYPEYGTLHDID